LRSRQLCSCSRTSQHFMEPESLLLYLVPILSQINPIYTSPPDFVAIRFNIINPSTYILDTFFLFFFSHTHLPLHLLYMTFPSHPFSLQHSNSTWQTVQDMKILFMQFSPSSVFFFTLGPNILLSAKFSNILRLCSSFNVRDQVSHPYRTTGNTKVYVY
jgi:hypothetical protein